MRRGIGKRVPMQRAVCDVVVPPVSSGDAVPAELVVCDVEVQPVSSGYDVPANCDDAAPPASSGHPTNWMNFGDRNALHSSKRIASEPATHIYLYNIYYIYIIYINILYIYTYRTHDCESGVLGIEETEAYATVDVDMESMD